MPVIYCQRVLNIWLMGMLLIGALGCQAETTSQVDDDKPVVDANSSATPTPYTLNIEPSSTDPTRIKVILTIPDVDLFKPDADKTKAIAPLLTFSIVTKENANGVPVLGEYVVTGDRYEFSPAFPIVRGEKYRARFDPAALKRSSEIWLKPIEQFYKVAISADIPTPEVQAIYPSGQDLPANHLKFYILFSEPMQQGDIFQYFSLYNVTRNKPVVRPFRHTELWSTDGKQLTLWFHPGRQKEGVNLNVEIGPILEQGKEYRLEISDFWPSLAGATFEHSVTKIFDAVAPDMTQPDITTWKEKLPLANTQSAYVCRFGEPLDWALINSKLKIVDSDGQQVQGFIRTGTSETSWQFHPARPWKAGTYHLVADPVLEDLAGNSLLRPFAVDLSKQQAPAKTNRKRFTRKFTIRAEAFPNK